MVDSQSMTSLFTMETVRVSSFPSFPFLHINCQSFWLQDIEKKVREWEKMRGNDQEWGSDKNRNCHSIHVLQKPLPKWFILFFMFSSFHLLSFSPSFIPSHIPHFFQSSPKRGSCFNRTKGILRSQKSKPCWKEEGYINRSKWHESFLTSSHQNCSNKKKIFRFSEVTWPY